MGIRRTFNNRTGIPNNAVNWTRTKDNLLTAKNRPHDKELAKQIGCSIWVIKNRRAVLQNREKEDRRRKHARVLARLLARTSPPTSSTDA